MSNTLCYSSLFLYEYFCKTVMCVKNKYNIIGYFSYVLDWKFIFPAFSEWNTKASYLDASVLAHSNKFILLPLDGFDRFKVFLLIRMVDWKIWLLVTLNNDLSVHSCESHMCLTRIQAIEIDYCLWLEDECFVGQVDQKVTGSFAQ